MTTTYLGIIDGMHKWEVRDASGAMVGTNQSTEGPA